jgi:hypothetical protein
VFFNGAFDPTLINTLAQYGGAVGQRTAGASVAAAQGALAVLVRSMTTAPDDVPHTGVVAYKEGVSKIPAAALSFVAADRLQAALKNGPATVKLTLGCRTAADEPSASVIGEITGSELPNEVIVMGGHLDSWDKGRGAHDDGAGVVHSLEALRLIRELGWKPKRTIRVVLFMNEEQTGTGGEAYAAFVKQAGEKPVAAIESDLGGFAPRGFSTSVSTEKGEMIRSWMPALSMFEAEKMRFGGGGGSDIGPLAPIGAALFGFDPENQRYFDYHHSDKDTIDKVNPRELELGAMSLALLAWLLSEHGVP